ncbi:MAG: AAA family ATPase [Gaiellaceae bacterium]
MPDRRSRIVVITGPPASGKSVLAQHLADDLRLPLIAKDDIKETLSEALGTGDAEHSKLLGRASFALVYHLLELELVARRSAIIEGNFRAEHGNGQFQRLNRQLGFTSLQIHCLADSAVLHDRYRRRVRERHPEHAESESHDEVEAKLEPARYLLDLPGELMLLDTTSFEKIDYASIRRAVEQHLVLRQDGDDQ